MYSLTFLQFSIYAFMFIIVLLIIITSATALCHVIEEKRTDLIWVNIFGLLCSLFALLAPILVLPALFFELLSFWTRRGYNE